LLSICGFAILDDEVVGCVSPLRFPYSSRLDAGYARSSKLVGASAGGPGVSADRALETEE
jgi:hypothetical protein